MELETKYNFGDKVHQIWKDFGQKWIECPFCSGEGRIFGKDKSMIFCPECLGRKGRTEQTVIKWAVHNILTIGEVRVRSRCNYFPEEISDFDNYGPQTKEYEEKYMCYETGIGSGTVWNVEVLFPSDKEAQAECDRLNDLENTK